jgi:hypothetical protein
MDRYLNRVRFYSEYKQDFKFNINNKSYEKIYKMSDDGMPFGSIDRM